MLSKCLHWLIDMDGQRDLTAHRPVGVASGSNSKMTYKLRQCLDSPVCRQKNHLT